MQCLELLDSWFMKMLVFVHGEPSRLQPELFSPAELGRSSFWEPAVLEAFSKAWKAPSLRPCAGEGARPIAVSRVCNAGFVAKLVEQQSGISPFLWFLCEFSFASPVSDFLNVCSPVQLHLSSSLAALCESLQGDGGQVRARRSWT